MTLLEIGDTLVLIREFNVGEALAFTAIDSDDETAIVAVVHNVVHNPLEPLDFLFIAEHIEVLLKTVEKLNPLLFKEQKPPRKEVSEKVTKAKEKLATQRFIESTLTLTENGHPNLLSYPYSYYNALVSLTNSKGR